PSGPARFPPLTHRRPEDAKNGRAGRLAGARPPNRCRRPVKVVRMVWKTEAGEETIDQEAWLQRVPDRRCPSRPTRDISRRSGRLRNHALPCRQGTRGLDDRDSTPGLGTILADAPALLLIPGPLDSHR